MITLKTPAEIAVMRKASQIVAEILEELAAAVRPGVTTEELDQLAEELTYKKGAKPAFKGYKPRRRRLSEDAVRVGQQRNRSRHPVEPQTESRATSSDWISAWYTRASMATRRAP